MHDPWYMYLRYSRFLCPTSAAMWSSMFLPQCSVQTLPGWVRACMLLSHLGVQPFSPQLLITLLPYWNCELSNVMSVPSCNCLSFSTEFWPLICWFVSSRYLCNHSSYCSHIGTVNSLQISDPQTWLVYRHTPLIFCWMLAIDWLICFPFSTQPIIILLPDWNCELT